MFDCGDKRARLGIGLALMAAAIGCGEGGAAITTGGGEGGTAACTAEDTFDVTRCPEHYPALQSFVFVDGDVETSGDGWSWDGAVKTVQEGIDLAYCGVGLAGESPNWSVWVKQGSYHVSQRCRLDAVRLRPNVHVYGGFAGNEASIYERDWPNNETILDGRDGPDGQEPVYHVVIGADDATLDGFVVQHGRADHESDPDHQVGAGMVNVSVSPTVDNCTFRDNFSSGDGAGMYVSESAATISATSFARNEAEGDGGGLAADLATDLLVTSCSFSDNVAEFGGGLYATASTLVIEASAFTNNAATKLTAGGVAGQGGGLYLRGGTAEVLSCAFHGNSTNRTGGGMCVAAGAVAHVEGSTFSANSAFVGGGMAVIWGQGTRATVVASLLFGNSAERFGGGLMLGELAQVDVVSSVIYGNDAKYGGGIEASSAGPLTLLHCTVADNTADDGAISGAADLAIDSSILWDPQAPEEIVSSGSIAQSVTYSDVRGHIGGTGNLDADPMFVDPGAEDYRLQSASPGIDAANPAGSPETDVEGNPRVGDPDMGAYEAQ